MVLDIKYRLDKIRRTNLLVYEENMDQKIQEVWIKIGRVKLKDLKSDIF